MVDKVKIKVHLKLKLKFNLHQIIPLMMNLHSERSLLEITYYWRANFKFFGKKWKTI